MYQALFFSRTFQEHLIIGKNQEHIFFPRKFQELFKNVATLTKLSYYEDSIPSKIIPENTYVHKKVFARHKNSNAVLLL